MIFKKIIEKITKDFSRFNGIDNNDIITYKMEHDFTIELLNSNLLLNLLSYLKKEPSIDCQQLSDLCAVDYLHYGMAEWNTYQASTQGFSRAAYETDLKGNKLKTPSRFAIVYHLLSYTNNLRIRVKCFLDNGNLSIPSCVSVWPSANWYEREVFDLFGINFINHPNLTRILTEENFDGFPLRKDFPLSGNSEIRFDAKAQQVIHEPIDIEPYNVVPKVIR